MRGAKDGIEQEIRKQGLGTNLEIVVLNLVQKLNKTIFRTDDPKIISAGLNFVHICPVH